MLRHHFDTMGTVASLAFVAPPPDDTLRSIELACASIDRRFSLYAADSEISRIAHGELALTDASEEFLESYAAAIDWRIATGGAFDPHRPDGVIDLSGIVKAQAVQQGLDRLTAAGIADAMISIGGDGVAVGRPDSGAAWSVGIIDPDDRATLLCSVQLDAARAAIASSGTAERGHHVWGPAATDFRQVTVAAADIVTADVLATAVLAGGRSFRDEATGRWDIDVLTVDDHGLLEVTPRMRRLITQHAA